MGWRPSLEQVADLVPSRAIRVRALGGTAQTFTADTVPDDLQAGRLIDLAMAWATGKLGATVPDASVSQATAATALWAAGLVELTYPSREGDEGTAAQLFAAASTTVAGIVVSGDQARYDMPPAWEIPCG